MAMQRVFLCSELCSNDAATKTVGHRASVHFEVSAPFLREGRGMVVGEENNTGKEEGHKWKRHSNHAPSTTNYNLSYLLRNSMILFIFLVKKKIP